MKQWDFNCKINENVYYFGLGNVVIVMNDKYIEERRYSNSI